MQLVVQNEHGVPVAIESDFSIDLQYGDGVCDFVLTIPRRRLEKRWMILVDGTSFGGVIDKICPSHNAAGDSIAYRGRTVQGVLAAKVIVPPSGQSHMVVSGDAHTILASVVSSIGLDDYVAVSPNISGVNITSYAFARYVDAYTGMRMMLSQAGARLRVVCKDGKHELSAVKRDLYGTAESERAYFDLEMDYLPVNHLIGLGKGEGAARAVSHWYADALGNVSQTQSLFGHLENAKTYQLNGEEPETLPGKTKSKLLEYQTASEATLKLPPGTDLDVGDRVRLSNAKFGIEAEAEVVNVVLKVSKGVPDVSYKFGIPDYPKDED